MLGDRPHVSVFGLGFVHVTSSSVVAGLVAARALTLKSTLVDDPPGRSDGATPSASLHLPLPPSASVISLMARAEQRPPLLFDSDVRAIVGLEMSKIAVFAVRRGS